jgi:hypothetical protein
MKRSGKSFNQTYTHIKKPGGPHIQSPAIISHFISHASVSNTRPKVDRLRDLLQRKRKLENEVEKNWAQIDDAVRATVAQAQRAVAARLQEVGGREVEAD